MKKGNEEFERAAQLEATQRQAEREAQAGNPNFRWGGSRPGSGRPAAEKKEPLIRASVGLSQKQRDYLRKLGDGNTSEGVRIVTDAYPELVGALEKIVNWSNLHPKDRQQARAALDGARGIKKKRSKK